MIFIIHYSLTKTMGKVDFELPIESLRGMLMRSDPYYFRRYPKTGGGVMHIVQARPNRKGHIPKRKPKTEKSSPSNMHNNDTKNISTRYSKTNSKYSSRTKH